MLLFKRACHAGAPGFQSQENTGRLWVRTSSCTEGLDSILESQQKNVRAKRSLHISAQRTASSTHPHSLVHIVALIVSAARIENGMLMTAQPNRSTDINTASSQTNQWWIRLPCQLLLHPHSLDLYHLLGLLDTFHHLCHVKGPSTLHSTTLQS